MTNTQPGNTGYMLASFRKCLFLRTDLQQLIQPGNLDNSMNSILAIHQVMQVTTQSGGPLIAGQANPLLLSSGCVNAALDGAMLYANDPSGARVGTFTDAGGVFKPFPGCGLNTQGQPAGVIHSMLVSCNVSLHPALPARIPL